jgi:hypothetical protein
MRKSTLSAGMCLFVCSVGSASEPVVKPSDVVFMYQADRTTYEQYGATVLAWGGTPTARSREAADQAGVKFFASVGMVTEFSRYYERFPESYEEGLCRDIDGQPVKVPWLTDHQHKGVPYWWCCTHQPQFREYLRERVVETVQAGADGVHIDDHLGTAGGLWLGICFCDRCVAAFQDYLRRQPAERLAQLGIDAPAEFHYRDVVRQWRAAADSHRPRSVTQHPLWNEWSVFQGRAAAAFMLELRELAAATAGRRLPIGANAGLLWPRHLADYQAIDLFSAETDHHASAEKLTDLPIVAYRMADAVGRPYAATASGGDWAYIQEKQLPGLVRGWVALSYAAGHCFMAPHRQWCYTPEKGTHWYSGPADKFAPLYQFVRSHARWLDGFRSYPDVAVLMPHRSFVQDPRRWFDLLGELSAANVSYRIVLAGDALVDCPLTPAQLADGRTCLIPDRDGLLPADRELVDAFAASHPACVTVAEVLATIKPAVRTKSDGVVRALPRVASGSAVIHLLNYEYDAQRDDVLPLANVEVQVDLQVLGVAGATRCELLAPDMPAQTVPVGDGTITVPHLGLWSMLVFSNQTSGPCPACDPAVGDGMPLGRG